MAGTLSTTREELRADEEGTGGRGPEGASDSSAGVATGQVFPVTFSVDGPSDRSAPLMILLGRSDLPGGDLPALEIAGQGVTHELPSGRFHAAVAIEGRGAGPVVTFEVETEPLAVELECPESLAARGRVLDYDTGKPINGATVLLEPSLIPAAWARQLQVNAQADVTGTFEVEGLAAGTWRVVGSQPGYGETETMATVEMGESRSPIDLGSIELPSLVAVRFRLVQHTSWDDLTEFSISHTHVGERVAFDSEGEATLHLGWYDIPLYLKLYFPDGKDSVIYLDGGVPGPEDVHQISVGGKRRLDVDLRMTSDIESRLEGLNTWINVSYRSVNGDANKLGAKYAGEQTYSFEAVQGNDVIASLEVNDGTITTMWKSQRVRLEPEGVTSMTLFIDSPPIEVLVVDAKNEPIAGFVCEVRQVPATTSWLAGGTSDEAGRMPFARVPESECSLSGYLPEGDLVAVDIPIDLSPAEATCRLSLAPVEPTFVEVSAADGPVRGIYVEWIGVHSATAYVSDETDEHGLTPPRRLVLSSRARIELLAEDYWVPFRSAELKPGRNALEIYPSGRVEVPSGMALERVYSDEFGVTLFDWLQEGLLERVDANERATTYRVPVGPYVVDREEPAEIRVLVQRSRKAVLPG
ncbi:MAG: carboxypeptidase-like regulatory domain-containing protein [Planctomycetota bacterium]